jgi:hypothetical protein
VELALEPLDGGRTDLEALAILEILRDPLWAKEWFLLDDRFGAPNGFRCETASRTSCWCAFGETREPKAPAHPLNCARGRRLWS